MKDPIGLHRQKAATPIMINQLPAATEQQTKVGLSSGTMFSGHELSRISLRPQAKLKVSQPGDAYEQEADAVAQKVIGMSENSLQREATPEAGEEVLQRKAEGTSTTAEEIPNKHILFEYIAHHVVYQDVSSIKSSSKQQNVLTKAGYSVSDIQWRKGPNDFQACLIFPLKKSAHTILPILAVMGTNSGLGFSTDLDVSQVGNSQFENNKQQIQELLGIANGKVNITGHSLGGTVAQIIAAHFTSQIANVVTFQSPGINKDTLNKFKQTPAKDRPKSFHHIAENDIVDVAGGSRLPGTVYQHERPGISPLAAHKAFLFATPAFKEKRESLGLQYEQYDRENKNNNLTDHDVASSHSSGIVKYDSYPHWIRRAAIETMRTFIGAVTAQARIIYESSIEGTVRIFIKALISVLKKNQNRKKRKRSIKRREMLDKSPK